MTVSKIGLLHPGEMGSAIGAALVVAGHEVQWASDGRSASTAQRATAAGLVDIGSVKAMIESCDLILSVCPPDVALEMATNMCGFGGIYVDANAIAPRTARSIADMIMAAGGDYVDGGIVGTPPTDGNVTRLLLSGRSAPRVAEVFAATPIDASVISHDPAAASAVKVCFAAWSKGTTALLLDIRALAVAEGVEGPLLSLWSKLGMDLESRSLKAGQQARTKGWRWVGEMHEIASTFEAADLPDGFHRAAAEVYARPERLEGSDASAATLRNVLDALRGSAEP